MSLQKECSAKQTNKQKKEPDKNLNYCGLKEACNSTRGLSNLKLNKDGKEKKHKKKQKKTKKRTAGS